MGKGGPDGKWVTKMIPQCQCMRRADPEAYVKQNKTVLIKILKHSSNTFTRALALAAIVEYGDEDDIEWVIETLKDYQETQEGGVR